MSIALLLLLAAPPANSVHGVPPSRYQSDPRLVRLRQFLQDAGSPATPLAEVFLSASDHHGLDWRLLPSLALVESGAGKRQKGNNLFGWASGEKSFTSMRAGIHQVASRLAGSRLYRGKRLPVLLRIYNRNPGYPALVQSAMRRLGTVSAPYSSRRTPR